MMWMVRNLKSAVAAWAFLAAAALAQSGTEQDPVDDLFAALATARGADAEQIVEKISSE